MNGYRILSQGQEGDEEAPVETTPPEPEEEEAEDDSAAEVEAGSP